MTPTVICVHCGYCLDGLPTTGLCPECATPVERSLRGDLLSDCSGEYLKALHHGVLCVQISVMISILIGIAFQFGLMLGPRIRPSFGPSYFPLDEGLWLFSAATGVAGWWCLSTADLGQLSTNNGETHRRAIRLSAACAAIAEAVLRLRSFAKLFTMGTASLTPPAPRGTFDLTLETISICAAVLSLSAWIAIFFAGMNYLRWLATRIPNEKIYFRASHLRWLAPILYVGGMLFYDIGSLLALLLYFNILHLLRLDLRRIRADVRASEAMRPTTS